MSRFDLDLSKLDCVCTDGAPSMVGKHNGFVAMLKKYMSENGIDHKLISYHCILHQENLCAKAIDGQTDVLKTVTEVLRFELLFSHIYCIMKFLSKTFASPSDYQQNSFKLVASSPFQVAHGRIGCQIQGHHVLYQYSVAQLRQSVASFL